MVLLDAGILTLNGTFVAQLIIFLVTLVVLYRFAWGPILKVLDERKRRIQEGIEAADRAHREREAAEAEYQSKLDEARREGQALIEKVTQQSDQLRKELEAKAREQAEQLIAKARTEIQQERKRAVEDLRRQVADIAVSAAGRVIGETLDPAKHRKLIDQAIEQAELHA